MLMTKHKKIGIAGLLFALGCTATIATAKPQRADVTPPKPQDRTSQPPIDQRAFGMCLHLIESGRFEDARRIATQLVKESPKSSKSHLLLALTYHKERNYEQALPHFQRAIQEDPNDHLIRPFYGWCLYNLGRSDEAQAMFEAFLNVNPDYADAHFAIGLIEFDRDHIAKAEKRFRKAIDLSQKGRRRADEAKAHARLADVLMRKDLPQQAKEHLEQAVTLNPNLYGAWFKLSRVLQRLGDTDGAKQAREKHIEVRDRVRPPMGHPE